MKIIKKYFIKNIFEIKTKIVIIILRQIIVCLINFLFIVEKQFVRHFITQFLLLERQVR